VVAGGGRDEDLTIVDDPAADPVRAVTGSLAMVPG
jgi:hypothetical protein